MKYSRATFESYVKMTYRELLQALSALDDSQLDCDVSIEFNGEFYEVSEMYVVDETDVLDVDHPVIRVNT